jgi:hypothetical protein
VKLLRQLGQVNGVFETERIREGLVLTTSPRRRAPQSPNREAVRRGFPRGMKGSPALHMILLPAQREDAAVRGLLKTVVVVYVFLLLIFIMCLLLTRRTKVTT